MGDQQIYRQLPTRARCRQMVPVFTHQKKIMVTIVTIRVPINVDNLVPGSSLLLVPNWLQIIYNIGITAAGAQKVI